MEFNYQKIKKLGSNTYYISQDGLYFIKESKKKVDKLEKEYLNLKFLSNNLNLEDIITVEPVDFIREKGMLITRYVDANPIIENLNPIIYHNFGKVLKNFHLKGYSHSHLEFNNVLFKFNKYILTDLPFLNKYPKIFDIICLEITIDMFKIKKPWNWVKYNKCFDAFKTGYGIRGSTICYKLYKKEINNRIDILFRSNSILSKIKGLIIKIFYKMKLIRWM